MLRDTIKKYLKEATGDSLGARGSYVSPLVPGSRDFEDSSLAPFTNPVSEYNNALLSYDSYDGKMDTPKKIRKKLENKSKKITRQIKNNPHIVADDDDGGLINHTPGKGLPFVPINEWFEITSDLVKESNSVVTAGLYNGPMELGLKKWKGSLDPFNVEVEHYYNEKAKKTKLKDNVNTVVGVWEKGSDGTYNVPTYDADGKKQKKINEDLGVWFGTKKKPKGSKQPKGPWVNICKKVDGKHPPCGRPEAKDSAYPKCRAAGVAGKMSDSQKQAACQQKRKAEKSHPKVGTGNKPKMVSYKKRTNESLDNLIRNVLRDIH